MTKYELSISTDYVPDWGIIEAFRELFQNALDNEIINPENKMGFNYDSGKGVVTISNKTSQLSPESLLLGCSTKATDKNTIGKHGEGYKLAFMVLLRNGKEIKVFNYGARETWDVKLVKSKRYNGKLITTVFVEKNAIWKKTPDNNLYIEVSGVTPEEYQSIQQRNLHIRDTACDKFNVPGYGDIILDSEEAGNIYVKGLFVTKIDQLQYGYDFEPKTLSLDRDRKLVDSFNVSWETSRLWKYAASKDTERKADFLKMFNNNALDLRWIENTSIAEENTEPYDAIANDFLEKYGDKAVPVMSNTEYELVSKHSEYKPVIVAERVATALKHSSIIKEVDINIDSTGMCLKDKFRVFMDKIEGKLTNDELEELKELIELIEE